MYQVLYCLTEQHDWRLVALGGAVCLLASAAAISLFHRARATHGPELAGLGRAGCRRRRLRHLGDAFHRDAGLRAGRRRRLQHSVDDPVADLRDRGHLRRAEHLRCSCRGRAVVALGGAIVGGGVAPCITPAWRRWRFRRASTGSTGTVTVSILLGIVFGGACAVRCGAARRASADALPRARSC